MDYAKEYVKEEQIDENNITIINHIRLYKRMLIPCELVRMNGDKRTF